MWAPAVGVIAGQTLVACENNPVAQEGGRLPAIADSIVPRGGIT